MNTLASPKFEIARRTSARKQLTEQLREMIVSGTLNEGSKLPSSKEISRKWQVAYCSVHAAMATLVKEGLLERMPKRGTFVAKRSRELANVGIYLWDDIWHQPTAAFRRTLVAQLHETLKKRGVTTEIWIDPRPMEARGKPWQELMQAADQRRIQAVIAVDSYFKWCDSLRVPVAVSTDRPIRNRVFFEPGAPERLAVEELVRQGCRSVGLISPISTDYRLPDGGKSELSLGLQAFTQAAQRLGVTVRNEWMQPPDRYVSELDAEHFGYVAMQHLLALPDRPEGIFVTHDWVARGAVLAVLERRVSVPEQLKLVLHRNVELGLPCPLPAAYVDYSIAQIAQSLIDLIDAQLRGEEAGPISIRPTLCAANRRQANGQEGLGLWLPSAASAGGVGVL